MQKLNGQSNICHLFNFGFENQTCYMAIELADSDLETMIIDKQKFDKYEVAWQVSNALEQCHKHGIVHRDIKTQNVLCFHRNQRWTYKLADFGIAGLIDADGKVRRLHSAEAGPTGCKAPEMFEPVYGPEVDVFSLASAGNLVLLYVEAEEIKFLATLTESESNSYKIKEIKTASLDDFYGHLDVDLVDILKKLMEPSPQKRMTVKEFRDSTFLQEFKNKHVVSNLEASKMHSNVICRRLTRILR
uniref:Transposase n=1 Tax=Ditylenchus dipsaci TaxID=166011 RepID=A0A915CYE4_9BILA